MGTLHGSKREDSPWKQARGLSMEARSRTQHGSKRGPSVQACARTQRGSKRGLSMEASENSARKQARTKHGSKQAKHYGAVEVQQRHYGSGEAPPPNGGVRAVLPRGRQDENKDRTEQRDSHKTAWGPTGGRGGEGGERRRDDGNSTAGDLQIYRRQDKTGQNKTAG